MYIALEPQQICEMFANSKHRYFDVYVCSTRINKMREEKRGYADFILQALLRGFSCSNEIK